MRVDFVHRTSKPTNPSPGYFYWVDYSSGVTEIWFSPDGVSENLILLNDKFPELTSQLLSLETKVDNIQNILYGIKSEILSEIDLIPYITENDLMEYAKKSDIPDKIELTDSDYEEISERVNTKLVWKKI